MNADFDPIGKWIPCDKIGNRAYDPRFIRIGDRIFLTYTAAPPGSNSVCGSTVNVVEIHQDQDSVILDDPIILTVPFQQAWEKNWVSFNYDNHLALAYSINPHVVIIPAPPDGMCNCFSKSESNLTWKWGVIRGGTSALLVDGEYLAFFHSCKEAPLSRHRTYYIGAYTFNAQPPFNITRISPKPFSHHNFYSSLPNHILTGTSSAHTLFPGGLALKDDRIYICYGENDACIKVMEINKKELYDSLITLKGN